MLARNYNSVPHGQAIKPFIHSATRFLSIRRNTRRSRYCSLRNAPRSKNIKIAMRVFKPNTRVQRPARLYRAGAPERTVRLDVCSANRSIALSAWLTASEF